jgi:hypothetical protein
METKSWDCSVERETLGDGIEGQELQVVMTVRAGQKMMKTHVKD